MKFDDIPATNNPSKENKGEKKSLFMPILIGVTLLVIILIIYSFYSSKNSNSTVVSLDTNSRLVQSLYTSVHDFKADSPYWMYEGETSTSISSMTESNKMVLAYLNLKASDFLEPDDCSKLPQTSYYGKLVCSNKTMILREDVERSYKEVFGDGVTMSTSINIRANPKDEVYVYHAESDSYYLYSSATSSSSEKFSKTYKYNYNVYKAEKVGDTIRIYEELTVEKVATGEIENRSQYLYTFVLAGDDMYSYTNIEKIS